MKFRVLGRTGIKVSDISFGAWAIGGGWGEQSQNQSIDALHKAIDMGINFIDTAAGYGDGKSEKIIAEVLKERRENVFVATKTPPAPGQWPPTPYCDVEDRLSEKYIRENVEERLRNLKTDCIDLLQIHTWTRSWNKNPKPFEILKKLQYEGKIKFIGVSTPEDDQNAVIDLMRKDYVDTVQVIFNIFEQEPAAELLPVAKEKNIGIIVRMAFDEGVLTGKYAADSVFPEGDFRRNYFAGDRLGRAVSRVEKIKEEIKDSGYSMPQAALKFSLSPEEVSTVIAGTRNVAQSEANFSTSDLDDLSPDLLNRLKSHAWRRNFWYYGK